MNRSSKQSVFVGYLFRSWLRFRYFLPKKRCTAFDASSNRKERRISKIFVINLNRAPKRWSKIQKELNRILDSSGITLLNITKREVAVDANDFNIDPIKDKRVDPLYTLADQLFVEPQPMTMPTKVELDKRIRMSRAEYAVAESHINIWEQIAKGKDEFVLVLEDDVWFHSGFSKSINKVWADVIKQMEDNDEFDIFYLSFVEVKNGAPKTILSDDLFKPAKGIWHLSGYVLSKSGAGKLLKLLPCCGPIDLWINHQFKFLDVLSARKSLISQRKDLISSNSYSILPSLTKIGAINSERASLYNIRPTEQPIFAFGSRESGQSSLAMALSMLGYRCCSDFKDLPLGELNALLRDQKNRTFNAYVNIGSLAGRINELRLCYPRAKFIITMTVGSVEESKLNKIRNDLAGADLIILNESETNKWRAICEHLRCAPPRCNYPEINEIGQRPIIIDNQLIENLRAYQTIEHDESPWVAKMGNGWGGLKSSIEHFQSTSALELMRCTDRLESLNKNLWSLRSDTFTDNLALFQPSNVSFISGIGAMFIVKKENLGVRDYSAAAISSKDQYLFGKFEATIKASNTPGVVTGFFLHRNSPRQEIDVEITGNRTDRLLINVFFNPGIDGANFDYGYRGTPTYIDLGFDASKVSHKYAIEWAPNEIKWLVDDKVVHQRGIWAPTPIPHLPMTLHANVWLTRSTDLAGRINNRKLPTNSVFSRIDIESSIVNRIEA